MEQVNLRLIGHDIQSASSLTKASPLTEASKQGNSAPTRTTSSTKPTHTCTAAAPPTHPAAHPAPRPSHAPVPSKAASLLGLAAAPRPHGSAPGPAHQPPSAAAPTAADPFPALARHRLAGPRLRRPDAEALARARVHDAVQARLRARYAARRRGECAADVVRGEMTRAADVDVCAAVARPAVVVEGAVESAVLLAFLRRVEGMGF